MAGILALADALRPESAAVVARLHEMGIRVVMLTGDNERTARAVARQAGLDDADVAAGLLPAEKAGRIRQLQAGACWWPWWATASMTPGPGRGRRGHGRGQRWT